MNKNEEIISATAMLLSIAKADDILDDSELKSIADRYKPMTLSLKYSSLIDASDKQSWEKRNVNK